MLFSEFGKHPQPKWQMLTILVLSKTKTSSVYFLGDIGLLSGVAGADLLLLLEFVIFDLDDIRGKVWYTPVFSMVFLRFLVPWLLGSGD